MRDAAETLGDLTEFVFGGTHLEHAEKVAVRKTQYREQIMKLFAIRIENGTTYVVQAADKAEALKCAGLTDEVLESVRSQGWRGDHASLVESGLGSQQHEIIELEKFFVSFELSEDGEYEMDEIGMETAEALDALYPILKAVTRRLSHSIWQYGLPDKCEQNRQLAEAVSQERTRLALPSV